MSDQLELTYAARYDQFNILESGFSPRVALVYKMNEKNTFRATYNIATAPPSALQTFIDFPVNVVVPNVYDIWLAGQVDAQGFDSNALVEYPFLGGLELPQGAAIPSAAMVGSLNAQGAVPAIIGELQSNPAYQQIAGFAPILQGVLTSGDFLQRLALGGSTSGQLSPGYNIFNGQPYPDPVDTGAAVQTHYHPKWDIRES